MTLRLLAAEGPREGAQHHLLNCPSRPVRPLSPVPGRNGLVEGEGPRLVVPQTLKKQPEASLEGLGCPFPLSFHGDLTARRRSTVIITPTLQLSKGRS